MARANTGKETKAKSASVARWQNAVPNEDEAFRTKRDTLIQQAGRSFRLKGYHNTSLDDVAARLGVSKPALYYYVKNKNEILYECISKALDLGEEALALAQREGKDPLDRLQRFIHAYIRLITSKHGALSVLTEHSSLAPDDQKRIAARRRKFDGIFREMVQECIDSRQIPPCEVKFAVFFFMGAINSITRWYRPEGSHDSVQVADAFLNFIMNGLRHSGAPDAARPTQVRKRRTPTLSA